jgi:ketosteroid isomerase-like protein
MRAPSLVAKRQVSDLYCVTSTRTPEWSARDETHPSRHTDRTRNIRDGVDDETTRATIEAIKRLDAAFDRGDIDAFMAAMTDDCVWESFTPAPDGQRHEGQAAVRQAMAEFLGSSPVFDGEEMLACGDRAVVRWTCHLDGGHVRGVDVLRVRGGKVAEILSYVKG